MIRIPIYEIRYADVTGNYVTIHAKKDYTLKMSLGKLDILLLDIEMGAMDGVTLAKTLRKENDTLQIVFLTGYSDYISEGYEVAALHYLLKPVQKEKLFSVLYRALDKVKKNEKMFKKKSCFLYFIVLLIR